MRSQKKHSPLLSLALTAAISIGAFSSGIETCLAVFSDMPPENRYSTAVDYLSSAGIVNGYPDGTFRPEKTVNRAEFLKLVLESAGITNDITVSSGFRDIDESAWYAGYVRKALKEGWVQGYPDKTFRPENGITKAEGLKMIGEVQNWQLQEKISIPPFSDTPADAWFTPYVDYAKTKNFLEDTGRFFIPELILTRGATAEILFRSYVTAASGATAFSSRLASTLPDNTAIHGSAPEGPVITPPPAPDFTPVTYKAIPATYFTGVTLKESFPNTFYLDEIYEFEGTVKTAGSEKAFVFLAPEGVSDSTKFINNIGEVNGSTLRIPVIFRKPGNYRLGLILGSSGESSVVNISVLPSLPSSSSSVTNPAPANLKILYGNLKTTVSWDQAENGLTRIRVFQGTRTKNYVSRQDVRKMDLLYQDFDGFSEGPVYFMVENAPLSSRKPLQVSGDWSSSGTEKFNAVDHNFSEYDTDLISIVTLPETYAGGQIIRFSGNTKTDIFTDAAITRPDGTVETAILTTSGRKGQSYGSETIPAGNDFSFAYATALPGTYFVEINSLDGEAVLNHPVYQSGSIPLLPDFFDISQYRQEETTFNRTNFRLQLLNLINSERKNAGLAAVTADPTLNNLAQLHSDDMVQRNFFGHINPDGETPNDRRLELGISTTVGENLAQAPTVLYTHYGLMRSGIHRRNILDPAWTRVGIGITENKDGQLFTTEEFSGNPLTEIDLINIENDIVAEINSRRQSMGIAVLEYDSVLAVICDSWSSKMTSLDFFDFVSPNGETLYDIVRGKINDKSVQAIILETSSRDRLIEEALSGNDATDKTWHNIGIGVKADNTGTLKATLLYST
jgi:uncharacterized protein YkwD